MEKAFRKSSNAWNASFNESSASADWLPYPIKSVGDGQSAWVSVKQMWPTGYSLEDLEVMLDPYNKLTLYIWDKTATIYCKVSWRWFSNMDLSFYCLRTFVLVGQKLLGGKSTSQCLFSVQDSCWASHCGRQLVVTNKRELKRKNTLRYSPVCALVALWLPMVSCSFRSAVVVLCPDSVAASPLVFESLGPSLLNWKLVGLVDMGFWDVLRGDTAPSSPPRQNICNITGHENLQRVPDTGSICMLWMDAVKKKIICVCVHIWLQ